MNYQQIFNEAHVITGPESNGYGELVGALEAVFKAAGYHITAKELAGVYHNQVVGSIGQTDLAAIAKSFIGWIRPADRLPFEVKEVAEARLPLNLSGMRMLQIPALTLFSWQASIDNLLKEGRIRRGTKRYEALIQEVVKRQRESSNGKPDGFRRAVQAAIDERRAEIEAVSAEMEVENKKALGYANYLRRTGYLVIAFAGVGQVTYDLQVARQLDDQADRIQAGIESREAAVQDRLADNDSRNIEEIVEWSVRSYPDLKEIWGKVK